MLFILINDLPYYFQNGMAFPCVISANKLEVDFKNGFEVNEVDGLYTEDEMKRRLGTKMVEYFDEKERKVLKKANKEVSSIVILPEPKQVEEPKPVEEEKPEDIVQPTEKQKDDKAKK